MTLITFLKHIKRRLIITWELWFTNKYFTHFFPKTFAQAGEDRILEYLFGKIKIDSPTYLDIGANYPIAFNNTYFLYARGCKGVCVEADPSLIPELKKVRKRDTILNVGVGANEVHEAEFYVFDAKGLNTFSKEEALFRESFGTYKIKEVIKVPLKTINTIIAENFKGSPNFIAIDVEGLDLDILLSLDFNEYRPDVICTETINYDEERGAKKQTEIIEFVCSKGYVVYADTHINTIFVADHYFPNLKTGRLNASNSQNLLQGVRLQIPDESY
jgi:FkbM family methyltransferase